MRLLMRLPALRAVVAVAVLALSGWAGTLGGCEGMTRTDSRYATPERTIETLLTAYGIEDVPQDELRGRIASGGSFRLVDRPAYEGCFFDMEGSFGEGLAGYVLGALAAGREDIRTVITGDRAVVSPREGVDVVLRRDETGAWRIVLRDSVPDEVLERMAAVAERAERTLRR